MNHPRFQFLDLQNLEQFVPSEEHLALSIPDADQPEVGEMVYALPFHICPTMALHEWVYVVRNQKVTETWTVAARKRNYPL